MTDSEDKEKEGQDQDGTDAIRALFGEGLGTGDQSSMRGALESVFNSGKNHKSDYILSSSSIPGFTGPLGADASARMQASVGFFEKAGWSHEQAIGITANLYAESGLRINAIGDSGAAGGIGQWHGDRRAEFQQKFGYNMMSPPAGKTAEQLFHDQLAFVNYELTEGREQRAGNALRGASSAEDAAGIFCAKYERPADIVGQSAHRAGIANSFMARFANAPPYRDSLPAGLPSDTTFVGDSIGYGIADATPGARNQCKVGLHMNELTAQTSNPAAWDQMRGQNLVVVIGRNDVGNPNLARDTEKLMANLEEARRHGVNIFIASPTYKGDRHEADVHAVASVIEQSARNHRFNYVDLNQGDMPSRQDSAMGIHFGKDGYRSLRDKIDLALNQAHPTPHPAPGGRQPQGTWLASAQNFLHGLTG